MVKGFESGGGSEEINFKEGDKKHPVTERVKNATENGELKRITEAPKGDLVWQLLKGESVEYFYSEHYGIKITINPDGSGIISSDEHGDHNFADWETGSYKDMGEGDFIERIREGLDFAKRVGNAIPSGNLEGMGGIKSLVQSFCEVQSAEGYYQASKREPKDGELNWPVYENLP